MQLSKDLKKTLTNELRYCAEKMNKERDARKKAFFFSNASDSLSAVLDLEYDPQLVLMDLVLEVSSGTISNRVETVSNEREAPVGLIDGMFDRLYVLLNKLADDIEEDSDIYKTLQGIAEIAFSSTDRGYYISTKGLKA